MSDIHIAEGHSGTIRYVHDGKPQITEYEGNEFTLRIPVKREHGETCGSVFVTLTPEMMRMVADAYITQRPSDAADMLATALSEILG
jgi:hypothetical protein